MTGRHSQPHPTPKSRVLDRDEVRQLLATSPAPDPVVSYETLSDAYRLDGDQCLLVFDDGTGRLYESRTEMLAAMAAVPNQQ
jgi:hypothetical protein